MARTKVRRAVAPYRAIRQLELNANQEFRRNLAGAKLTIERLIRESNPDPEYADLLQKGIGHYQTLGEESETLVGGESHGS